MNTKEAIRFLEFQTHFMNDVDKIKVNEIIELLEHGEKYEAIVNEIDKRLIPGELSDIKDLSTLEFVKLIIKDIKQKYFPEPKSKGQRINDILYDLNTMGRAIEIKELTNLLIELRDEEE